MAAAEAERQAIRAAARASLAAQLRDARGVEAPAEAPAAPAPVPAAPAADMAAQLQAQFALQTQEAARLRAEAEAIKTQAEAKAAAAEAKLAQFNQNPAAWLQAQGLDLDQWNQRLVQTGGEPTPEEKMLAQLDARAKAAEAKVDSFLQAQQAQALAAQRTALETQLAPELAEKFPLVAKMLGTGPLIDHMLAEKKRSPGTPMDLGKLVSDLEADFTKQLMGTLEDVKIRAKVLPSATTPQAEAVVSQGPRTISNRVTSSVTAKPAGEGLPSLAERRAAAQEIIRAMMANR